jgi:hypothetical protein
LTKDKFLETPILFLVFNRPDTAKQVFESIRKVKPKQLFIAADGPRKERLGEFEKCEQVKSIVKNVDWNCEVKTLFRLENLGCGKAVSEAITWFFEQVEEGIILEDDCLPSDSFYKYCSELLQKYRDDDRIMHIGASNFQEGKMHGNGSYYFTRLPHIWGWATWRRAWKRYDYNMSTLEDNKVFDFIDSEYGNPRITDFWRHNFNSVAKEFVNTWDYQWCYAIWYFHGLSISPNLNLVQNIGFSEDGTHTLDPNHKFSKMNIHGMDNIIHPERIIVSKSADLIAYFTAFEISKQPFIARIRVTFNVGIKKFIKYLVVKLSIITFI